MARISLAAYASIVPRKRKRTIYICEGITGVSNNLLSVNLTNIFEHFKEAQMLSVYLQSFCAKPT
ncbi:hypothetical protein LX64_03934 [Chitinophaga skermanii]|uniref:Uncharacterized protein n=1 Tax=Chitinophaga skermanii TaxID=331697 RepID=A0A327QAR0_9BACT|nr:hypothetical protein LX64_03934 [Chitinophaga skermanii]